MNLLWLGLNQDWILRSCACTVSFDSYGNTSMAWVESRLDTMNLLWLGLNQGWILRSSACTVLNTKFGSNILLGINKNCNLLDGKKKVKHEKSYIIS